MMGDIISSDYDDLMEGFMNLKAFIEEMCEISALLCLGISFER